MKKFTGGKRTFGSLYLLKQTMLNDKKYDYSYMRTTSVGVHGVGVSEEL